MRQDAEALALGRRGQDTRWFHRPVAEAAPTDSGEDLRTRQFCHGDVVITVRSSLFLLLCLRSSPPLLLLLPLLLDSDDR